MIHLLEPLTKTMITQLRKARAIERSKGDRNICVADDFEGSFAELYSRGFVDTKMIIIDGKEIPGIFITKAGQILLEKLDKEEAKKLGSVFNIYD